MVVGAVVAVVNCNKRYINRPIRPLSPPMAHRLYIISTRKMVTTTRTSLLSSSSSSSNVGIRITAAAAAASNTVMPYNYKKTALLMFTNNSRRISSCCYGRNRWTAVSFATTTVSTNPVNTDITTTTNTKRMIGTKNHRTNTINMEEKENDDHHPNRIQWDSVQVKIVMDMTDRTFTKLTNHNNIIDTDHSSRQQQRQQWQRGNIPTIQLSYTSTINTLHNNIHYDTSANVSPTTIAKTSTTNRRTTTSSILTQRNDITDDNQQQQHQQQQQQQQPCTVLSVSPTWLWCNDPTFIHATSGQHLRTHRLTMEYYARHIQVQSVEITRTVSHDTTTPTDTNPHPHYATNTAATTTINDGTPPPSQQKSSVVYPMPPGSLHPRNVYTTMNDYNGNNDGRQQPTSLSTSSSPPLLLHVVWAMVPYDDNTIASQKASHPAPPTNQRIDSYYDVAWLIRCCLPNNNNNNNSNNNSRTNNVKSTIHPADKVEPHHQRQQHDGGNMFVHTVDNNPVNVSCYNYNVLKLDDNNNSNSNKNNIKATTLHDNGPSVQLSDMGRYTLLNDIFCNGAVLVQNVPPPPSSSIHQNVNPSNNNNSSSSMLDDVNSPVACLGRALSGGRLSHGQLYGDVFHVCDKTTTKSTMTLQNGTHPSETQFTLLASDTNIAYTTLALCPHQDLAYYESIPGLQLLHCIENDSSTVQGGASTLIDVIAATTVFQQLAPDLFDILLHCDATFIKQRDGADMIYRRPHIQCSLSDQQIISVRWSPPFEGPLLSIPQQLVEDYYVAYSAFERLIDNSLPRLRTTNNHKIENRLLPHISYELENDLCDYANNNTWEYRMQRGDMLIFNNQRMLHGRRAYTLVPPTPPAPARATGSAGRHLMGCYTNIDDTLCQYRLLRRQHYQNLYKLPYIPTVGNGSSIVP